MASCSSTERRSSLSLTRWTGWRRGSSWSFPFSPFRSLSFSSLLSGVPVGPARDGLFALFFLGFGVKAGIIPLHVWLPEAHPAAPTSISALMSAVLIKTGIYGIVRVCAFGLGVPRLSWGVVVLALGGLSAVLGVLYALMP